MTLDVVILAAGQGTRMRSTLPKVLHRLAGKPMVRHVIDTAGGLSAERTHVVVGHGAEKVREALADCRVHFALQAEQKGTGHAVSQALDGLGNGKVLVLYGDVPLIQRTTLERLLKGVDDDHLGLLTVTLDDPSGYGRILRNAEGQAVAIVEHKDASESERAVRECNTGIMAMTASQLRRWLPRLSADNAQGEYYLTDIIAMAAAEGVRVVTAQPGDPVEVEGVNNRLQMARLERAHQQAIAEKLMTEGVALADPSRLDVRGTLRCGHDVEIDVGCVFEGEVELGEGVRIGPHCVIRDSHIGAESVIEPHSVIEGAVIAGHATIGPFARLRPGSRLAVGTKVGNFVETKNVEVGEGSKINHLSYVGDARLGRGVNVGAGTITCNYDGANKHHTEIDDEAFIGSNSALVAPVSIGRGATVGAGSTVAKDVPDNSLAVTRARQMTKADWPRPRKQDD
ncbi:MULTISPECIES: bifunctional UDP-N-acetylglucosamine diphosphorylase/glucosamine-1-phosphate N-acetyltransferase GlmU [unclassified Halomonas]|uniref:bifunctional UDP-N-acetylglucosamine diphosphorylase/glucosamine-1-phosphate N-acetyltransferase GlmU n=1 Tax=unclassified Halomonas TaxID=2609666 RepID=UPI002885CFC2|nr:MULTISPECIES: bifunctional UDP-N-acetylglucosamine diphosphorylase/glucosamine-1-phosphate N-acetyltransferase GlmU [unclassified Halomonas]MDT0500918.1 bifunctional UDP-N-acetylglucosamine diphosphorylase/glucosamine-1-phosphate N-acetyltransferase GlmU [Halomonas sp. PAR7]MDT0512654.1 bifunctional UDP-N-acetylglucosamine diphosphorylase/glucosamine-1-phosphate N-acetyltransferase GlmU [Halomonas sp. LES1]MDT0592028.1 bifunctional UDP-N-acetylglucosamine diphosphorylase/glucosamine-1-phospha